MSAWSGQSLVLSAGGSNFGSLFVMLAEYSERQTPDLYSEAIIARLRERFKKVTDAQVSVFPPPPVRGVGRAGGFKVMIEDRGNQGPRALQGTAENLVELGNSVNIQGKRRLKILPGQRQIVERPAFTEVATVFRANVPSLYVDINRAQAMAMRVPYKDATDTMQIYLGSLYVNDFNLFGRTWQVIIQADMEHRDKADNIRRLQVRNEKNEMVPLGSVASVNEINGPLVLMRYNTYPAAPVTGNAAAGVSSGEAIDIMQKLADSNLPPNMTYEWTELAYLEVKSGNTAMLIFGFAVVMVFLVLAAQYESWSLPLAVILVVPMCILCALAGVAIGRQDINIFTQIGFVVLVGLASKNAILIVEFAKHLREAGADRREATLKACQLRLRPIVMTSMAFILGVVPLLISHGAGAEMRRTLGTAVFAGMLGVTLFGLFLTPVFFYLVDLVGNTRLFTSRTMRFIALAVLFPLRTPAILARLVRGDWQ
jgi:multidrug efflux pump